MDANCRFTIICPGRGCGRSPMDSPLGGMSHHGLSCRHPPVIFFGNSPGNFKFPTLQVTSQSTGKYRDYFFKCFLQIDASTSLVIKNLDSSTGGADIVYFAYSRDTFGLLFEENIFMLGICCRFPPRFPLKLKEACNETPTCRAHLVRFPRGSHTVPARFPPRFCNPCHAFCMQRCGRVTSVPTGSHHGSH